MQADTVTQAGRGPILGVAAACYPALLRPCTPTWLQVGLRHVQVSSLPRCASAGRRSSPTSSHSSLPNSKLRLQTPSARKNGVSSSMSVVAPFGRRRMPVCLSPSVSACFFTPLSPCQSVCQCLHAFPCVSVIRFTHARFSMCLCHSFHARTLM